MEHVEAASHLDGKYAQILEEFHQVLERHDLHDFRINSIEFLHAPELFLRTSGCPEGTTATTKCVAKPGGGVHCFTVCSR